MTRAARAALAVALTLVATACQMRIAVTVDIDEDGSGTVEVGVGIDDDAIQRLPDVDGDGARTGADMALLASTDDLEATGWRLSGPVREDDGFTWMRAEKAFGDERQASQVLDEIAGARGPFQGFRVERDTSFARTTLRFRGTVDFSGGLESLGDEALAAELDGEPLGEDQAEIERRIGTSLSRAISVRVAVRMPGDVESNAPSKASNGAVWEPTFGGEPAQLEAASEVRHTATIAWLVVAAVAGFALVLLLLVRLAVRTRGNVRSPS